LPDLKQNLESNVKIDAEREAGAMMKTVPAVISVVCVAVFALAAAAAAPAQECPTKGDVAVAIAQVLGYEVNQVEGVDEVQEAVAALENVGLVEELWEPLDACVDAAFVQAVSQALQRSVNVGLLNHDEIAGLWELVFELTGHPEMIKEFAGLPIVFPGMQTPAKAWYPLEGTIQDAGPGGEVDVVGSGGKTTEASPFVP
jgi:hypothetical protein